MIICHASLSFQKRFAHSFVKPSTPNMDAIKRALIERLSPIYFQCRQDIWKGAWVNDQFFYGAICSPAFEGKGYYQMQAMVDDILDPLGMKDRCRFFLNPPSRWVKFRHIKNRHWGVDE